MENEKIMRNFRKFEVWKNGRKLVNRVYDASDTFPSHEKFGLTSQVNRAAVSIILNIAEGSARSSDKDFARFLEFSIGSAFEVENVLLIATDRKMISESLANEIIEDLQSIQRQLNTFISKLRG